MFLDQGPSVWAISSDKEIREGMRRRQFDHRANGAEMDRLRGLQRADPVCFSLSMVADLPEPARRYFAFAHMTVRDRIEATKSDTVTPLRRASKFD